MYVSAATDLYQVVDRPDKLVVRDILLEKVSLSAHGALNALQLSEDSHNPNINNGPGRLDYAHDSRGTVGSRKVGPGFWFSGSS